MKKGMFALVILGMLGWGLVEYDASEKDVNANERVAEVERGEESAARTGHLKGELAHDFELTTIDGETVKLSDYRGQRIMLNFWATWCPPCRAEMPDMQKFHENKDVKILAVNLTETESDLEKVQQFVDERALTFPIVLDERSEVSKKYHVVAYPTTFMIDSNGRIQFVAMGAMNYDRMVQHYEMMR